MGKVISDPESTISRFPNLIRKRIYELDFRKTETKYATHEFHRYPAMMIGPVAKYCLSNWLVDKKMVLDPFVGSGSVLVESMLMGKNSIGVDLNPLAVLISRVKTTPIKIKDLTVLHNKLIINFKKKLQSYTINSIDELNLTNPNVWFSSDVLKKLILLKKLIYKDISEESHKEFFLVCLSETIREVSFTRNSEFKRYRMEKQKIEDWNPDVLGLFNSKIRRNISGLKNFVDEIPSNTKHSEVYHADARSLDFLENKEVDGVLTSPPYGDSKTTVAYGQFSQFANELLELGTKPANQLDSRLLGGSRTNHKKINLKYLSDTLDSTLESISQKDEKRALEVNRFFQGYYEVFLSLEKILNENSTICYVVGNRTVKGIWIETDKITVEMLSNFGYDLEGIYVRDIPNKTMPSRNSPTNVKGKTNPTMLNEFIVVMKRN